MLQRQLFKYMLDQDLEGIVQILAKIKIMDITVEIFINEIKLGKAIIIPMELRISNWPASFRFYDPLISVLQHRIDNHTKLMYIFRKMTNVTSIVNNHLGTTILKKIEVSAEKISYQRKEHHKGLRPTDIDYNKSIHCNKLQMGEGLIIQYKQEDIKIEDILTKDAARRDTDLDFLYIDEQRINKQN